MGLARLAFLYALFAGISTLANLATQVVSVRLYDGPLSIPTSVIVGTVVGLPIKYVLDKVYIFRFVADGLRHDGRLFLLYSAMALVTTGIFWGTELLFHAFFGTETMRLVGAALGLAVGYLIKYQLDFRFVFVGNARRPKEFE